MDKTNNQITNKINYQKHAFTIKGEDSESEEELDQNNATKLQRIIRSKSNINIFNFLLNWKIVESYSFLWKQFNNYLLKYFSAAKNQLMSTDNYIMQSEVTLQSIYYNMELLNNDSEIILRQLKLIASENFIPVTRI